MPTTKKTKAAKPKKVAKKTKPGKSAAKKSRGAGAGTDPKRVAAILAKLDEAYPNANCELNHHNAFELLIATILSAQCTDVRVNQVTETLFKKYPSPEAFAYATPSELEKEIRPTGFFRNKTKSVMGASKAVVEQFGGQVPRTMEEMLTLGSRAKDSQRCARHRLRHRKRRGGRYARAAPVEAPRPHPQRRPQENRAGPDGHHPAKQMDPVLPPTHLARPARLLCPQTQLRRLQLGIPLRLQRQNRLVTQCVADRKLVRWVCIWSQRGIWRGGSAVIPEQNPLQLPVPMFGGPAATIFCTLLTSRKHVASLTSQ